MYGPMQVEGIYETRGAWWEYSGGGVQRTTGFLKGCRGIRQNRNEKRKEGI